MSGQNNDDIKLIRQVSNMDRAAAATTIQERNYFTQLALSEQLLKPEQPIEYTSETVRKILSDSLAGTRAFFGQPMKWDMARKPTEEESFEYFKTWMGDLMGMEERAGAIGMILSKLGRLDDEQQIVLVARHVPRYYRTRWNLNQITPIFDLSLNAAVLVALRLVPKIGDSSKHLRDAVVARHFGINEGTQVEAAARLGISEEHFCRCLKDARRGLSPFELNAMDDMKLLIQGKEQEFKDKRKLVV